MKNLLTNICTQCVHTVPTIMVPINANTKPPFLNAKGIASIPLPNELFNKCIKDPIVLLKKNRK